MKLFFNQSARAFVLIALCLVCIGVSAQDDVIRTVPDKGLSGKFFAKLCPKTDVAIDKNEAEVYSVYTDGATARFAQLRIRKGKYVIKAGDCAIIKTSEAKEIKLEPTSDPSSIVWTDLICPDKDMTVPEFKTAYGVSEGQYIYMLTNLVRNGGFGFTHFGGKTLRAGNFYIVVTRNPGTTGIISVREMDRENAPVYNLQGVRTVGPQKPGIYVRNGKKFVVK